MTLMTGDYTVWNAMHEDCGPGCCVIHHVEVPVEYLALLRLAAHSMGLTASDFMYAAIVERLGIELAYTEGDVELWDAVMSDAVDDLARHQPRSLKIDNLLSIGAGEGALTGAGREAKAWAP